MIFNIVVRSYTPKEGVSKHCAFLTHPSLFNHLFLGFLLAPVIGSHTLIAAITPFGIFLGCGKQLGCFFRILFSYGRETHLPFQEVLEIFPFRLFTVELERILTFFLQLRVVAPQVPVTASNGSFPSLHEGRG